MNKISYTFLVLLSCVACVKESYSRRVDLINDNQFSYSQLLGKNLSIKDYFSTRDYSTKANDVCDLNIICFNEGGYAVFGPNREPVAFVEEGSLDKDSLIHFISINRNSKEIRGEAKYAILAYYALTHNKSQPKTKVEGIENDSVYFSNFFLQVDTLVRPLCYHKWGQTAPFNLYMPVASSGQPSSAGKCLAGCGPIAIAMMFMANQYPFSILDTCNIAHDMISLSDVANITNMHMFGDYYTWIQSCPNALKNTTKYLASSLRRIGNDINVIYNSNGTSSRPDSILSYISRNGGIYQDCTLKSTVIDRDNLIQMILNNHPSIIFGDGNNSGHIWLADGYIKGIPRDGIIDSQLVHFNWGWIGYSDGYYYLDLLDATSRAFKDPDNDVAVLILNNHQYDSSATYLLY